MDPVSPVVDDLLPILESIVSPVGAVNGTQVRLMYEAAKNVMCMTCRQTFLLTVRGAAYDRLSRAFFIAVIIGGGPAQALSVKLDEPLYVRFTNRKEGSS